MQTIVPRKKRYSHPLPSQSKKMTIKKGCIKFKNIMSKYRWDFSFVFFLLFFSSSFLPYSFLTLTLYRPSGVYQILFWGLIRRDLSVDLVVCFDIFYNLVCSCCFFQPNCNVLQLYTIMILLMLNMDMFSFLELVFFSFALERNFFVELYSLCFKISLFNKRKKDFSHSP